MILLFFLPRQEVTQNGVTLKWALPGAVRPLNDATGYSMLPNTQLNNICYIVFYRQMHVLGTLNMLFFKLQPAIRTFYNSILYSVTHIH